MFKKTAITAALLSGFAFQAANAVDTGNINFTGTVIDSTCEVNGASPGTAIAVPMGVVQKSEMAASVGANGPTQSFSIALTGCDAAITGATVSIDGTRDADISALLALTPGGTAATGVGIELSTGAGPYTLGTALPVALNGNAGSVDFTARYQSSNATVVAGEANAVATYSISYQ